ncbi:hypothetical protein FW755_12485 [Lonepinella koalarum]|uniref:hypothetical protein n=1 Tax=Lonepinella koalarum TaxID=53417 RepID=UPI0011E44873|nr:hypothetical protein [Lonepinella koalarum]TYG33315.1 hypothetical protein FW755_12485 [Lonepinella koalarum]
MKTTTDKTIRLKKQEAIDLKDISFELTKKAIMAGHQKLYKESDIVHYLIENLAKCIQVNQNGSLSLDYDKVTNLYIKEEEHNKPYAY